MKECRGWDWSSSCLQPAALKVATKCLDPPGAEAGANEGVLIAHCGFASSLPHLNSSASAWNFSSLTFFPLIFKIKCIGVPLVNNSIYISGTWLYKTTSVYPLCSQHPKSSLLPSLLFDTVPSSFHLPLVSTTVLSEFDCLFCLSIYCFSFSILHVSKIRWFLSFL